jgi:multidrug efflux pump subunit AcrB
MKHIKILITTATLFSGIFLYGQARDASVMIEKENRNAIMITIDQPEKITRDALQQRMERSGLKEKERKGIASYKGVTLSEISPGKVDIYTKVEEGPNNSSIVYMAVSTGYNNFTNSAGDSSITQNVKTFLESFVKDADTHSADLGIRSQIKDVIKDEKNYQKLLDEQKDLQKKKSGIESRLTEIENELNIRAEGINKKKSGVEDAKIKRSNISGQ